MVDLWNVEGPNCDQGYLNLQVARFPVEAEIRLAINDLWEDYEPYADPDFRPAFARDPEARFWEMYLGARLLRAGKELRPAAERLREGGQPDLCVADGERRIWIEAIAPDVGQDGPDQVRTLLPINEGGEMGVIPQRQVQLRMTAALWTKQRAMDRYENEGLFGREDIRLIAINAGRFGLYADERPFPSIISAVFPFGNAYLTLDRATGEVVGRGFDHAPLIQRVNGNVPRTAFLSDEFGTTAGVIWSRVAIGNMSQAERPLSFVHNLKAERPMPVRWGVWDREWVAALRERELRVSDVLS